MKWINPYPPDHPLSDEAPPRPVAEILQLLAARGEATLATEGDIKGWVERLSEDVEPFGIPADELTAYVRGKGDKASFRKRYLEADEDSTGKSKGNAGNDPATSKPKSS